MKKYHVTVRSVVTVEANTPEEAGTRVEMQMRKWRGVEPDGLGAQILTNAEIADNEDITEVT